jgi:hypothetical protein
MKGDMIKIKGEDAQIIAEALVSTIGRKINVRVCQLIPSGILVVIRNGFIQGTFADKDQAKQLFLIIVGEEAFL